MALNQFMHPRNIYRIKKNFSDLAVDYPEFEQFLKHFPNGNTSINFKDHNAVRCLTKCLLHKDFQLDVQFPDNRLIPAVPQRLNYVLWVEDLVGSLQPRGEIRGLDVGTGCCCIFCLLVCRLNPSWKMDALELDVESFKWAIDNVNRNDLSSRIDVIQSEDWLEVLNSNQTQYTFTMCNPPFFGKEEHRDMCQENNEDEEEVHRKSPANVSSPIESEVLGGESNFVQTMISDSFNLKDRVKIFTVMLGKKSSLKNLKKHLRNYQQENDDLKFTSTQFCQGKTMRWGLAWSFTHNLESCNVTTDRKSVV